MPPVKQKCKYADKFTSVAAELIEMQRKEHQEEKHHQMHKEHETSEATPTVQERLDLLPEELPLVFDIDTTPEDLTPVGVVTRSEDLAVDPTVDAAMSISGDLCWHKSHHSFPKSVVENDSEPWHPFQTHGDFKFSELAHKAALNKDLTNQLLTLIQWLVSSETRLTLHSDRNVMEAWAHAAKLMMPFEKHVVNVHHAKHNLEFDVHYCPLWDWAMDILQDPLLQPHFIWDAQCLYKHNGECFEHFIDEPWTGDRWWNIQSLLPQENAAPFTFILYTDKSHLSSLGKVKAYPVIMHCGNLPIHIRNSNHSLGGGQLVGWLPIDSANDRKLSYTNLKRVVWHQAFLRLLDSITCLSKVGFTYKTHNGLMRTLYPIILILSADYEEHLEEAIACFELYKQSWHIGEELMQMDLVNHSCPHAALCFDPLHVNDGGLFCNHLFVELKRILASIGRHAEKMVDTHDGNKLLDIAKQIIFTTQNVLTHKEHPIGFTLLHCIASYLQYHMYILLDVHTETTLTARECGLHTFQNHLEEYITMHDLEVMQKNWNFPKYYLLQTNRKDAAKQILRLDHKSLVSEFIQSRLEHLDQTHLKKTLDQGALEDDKNEILDDHSFSGHIYLGSPQKPVMLAYIEENCLSCVFWDFCKKLSKFLNDFLLAHNIPIPGG
ncbi:hypothetical protein EDD16DRAFT_1514591 [Pisolithus croceorrhizus]|nr:hypothetical protein EV401DRAFT_1884114 [Pisolithus croceorrhizus]KAI6132437.1 hypothetical protein EDD16DRAFT_1514591 [Pisolithus croceorrhizus]KAI6168761.1 hypothetical protein EDD17DRAFT_1503525 [Pisolithus thermaeus]